MVINAYTQSPVALYNPMSMEELAFAPTFLRQRHDLATQGLAELEQQSNQYDVLDPYAPIANQLVQPLQENIQGLAERLAKQGVQRSQAIPEAMRLKSQYNQLFGQQGAIGQLQARTQRYRETAKKIQEQFKEAPDLANFLISRLNAGEATIGPNGKLQLGAMATPSYVRDIPQEKILDRLNTAVKGLSESDLAPLQMLGKTKIGDFTDLAILASQTGVTGERAQLLMQSLLSQEEKNSIAQRGAMYGLTPEESLKDFTTKMAGIAVANASTKTNYRTVTVKDDLGLQMAKEKSKIPVWVGDYIDGVGTSLKGLEKMQLNEMSDLEKIKNNPDEYIVKGRDGRDKIRIDQNGNPVSRTDFNRLGQSASIKTIDYDPNFEANIKNELSQINPQFTGLSNKQVLQRVSNYKKQVQSHKVEVLSPVGESLGGLQDRIVGSKNKTGMLFNRQISLPDGTTANSKDALQRLGFSSIDEFYEKGAPAVRGYVPEQGAYAIAIKDPKDNKNLKFIYVEADESLKEKTSNTMLMSTLGRTGTVFEPTQIPFKFEGDDTLYRKYYVNDLSDGVNSGKLVIAPWGNKNNEPLSLNELYKNGKLIPGATEISFSEVAQAEKAGFKTSSNSISLFGSR